MLFDSLSANDDIVQQVTQTRYFVDNLNDDLLEDGRCAVEAKWQSHLLYDTKTSDHRRKIISNLVNAKQKISLLMIDFL